MRAVHPEIFIFFCLTFVSCSIREEKGAPPPLSGTAPLVEENVQPGFQKIYEQVLRPRCLNCHAVRRPFFSNYEQAFREKDSIRVAVLEKKVMPPSGEPRLSAVQLQLLKAWLDAGAPMDEGKKLPPPVIVPPVKEPANPQEVVTYKQLYEKVIDPKCMDCHFPENKEGLTSLDNIQLLQDAIGTVLFVTVVNSQMPPKDYSKQLTREDKELLTRWVLDGMKP